MNYLGRCGASWFGIRGPGWVDGCLLACFAGELAGWLAASVGRSVGCGGGGGGGGGIHSQLESPHDKATVGSPEISVSPIDDESRKVYPATVAVIQPERQQRQHREHSCYCIRFSSLHFKRRVHDNFNASTSVHQEGRNFSWASGSDGRFQLYFWNINNSGISSPVNLQMPWHTFIPEI